MLGNRETMGRWVAVLVPALLVYFLPVPALTAVQRHLLAVFIGTIIALVARPVPMGVSVIVAMTLLVLTQTLPAGKALSGFSNTTVWLIFSAFLFSKGVTATKFGLRVAYVFIRKFAFNSLSLGYAIAATDLVLAPFVPSDTARGGGIVYPIARSLARAFNSEPGPTAGRMGAFLMLVAFHATYSASALFLTSMAANPLMAEFALKIAKVELTWLRWILGSCVPGLLTMILVPYVIYRLHPPEISDTHAARQLARSELESMGPMSSAEIRLVIVLLGVMAGWVTSPWHSIPNAFVALAGVSAILLLRVISWDDLLSEGKAWDALVWFAPLIMMADSLNEAGVIKILSESIFSFVQGWPFLAVLVVLAAAYFYIHYSFAGMTAHITALYPGFLGAMLVGGVPPLLAALVLAYFSNLNAGLTHYGTGSAPVFFGDGYVSQGTWWKLGFLISLLNMVIWLGPGLIWWRLVGLW